MLQLLIIDDEQENILAPLQRALTKKGYLECVS